MTTTIQTPAVAGEKTETWKAKPATAKPKAKKAAAKSKAAKPAKPAGKIRDNSKQATLIALLKSAKGATMEAMMKATGWQSHSVRGLISAVLRKRLGLDIAVETSAKGDRVYKIAH